MSTLTQEEVHRLLEYRDGKLFWKIPRRGVNKNSDGDYPVGWINGGGYWRLKLGDKSYYSHQIIYFMHHGYIPEFIDHIDNNKANNRIENLRSATKGQNNTNRPAAKANRLSRSRGVIPSANGKRWHARVQHNKKSIHLGTFDDLELADLVAMEARNLYHGAFAHHGLKGA